MSMLGLENYVSFEDLREKNRLFLDRKYLLYKFNRFTSEKGVPSGPDLWYIEKGFSVLFCVNTKTFYSWLPGEDGPMGTITLVLDVTKHDENEPYWVLPDGITKESSIFESFQAKLYQRIMK